MDNGEIDDLVFNDEVIEKVRELARILEGIASHPRLNGNLALHGGTALNLFLFKPTRLSVDLDLNYIASQDRNVMLRDQMVYVEAVKDVAYELGLRPIAGEIKHAGCTSLQ